MILRPLFPSNRHPTTRVEAGEVAGDYVDPTALAAEIKAGLGISLRADPANPGMVNGYMHWSGRTVDLYLYEKAAPANAIQRLDPLTKSPRMFPKSGFREDDDLHATTWAPHGLTPTKIDRLIEIVRRHNP